MVIYKGISLQIPLEKGKTFFRAICGQGHQVAKYLQY